MFKRLFQFFFGVVVCGLIGSVPVLAQAQVTTGQTITVITGTQSTELLDSSQNVANRDYIPDHPFWVNRDECAAGWIYQIGVTTTGINGMIFEVWATSGGDCSLTTSRYPGSTNPVCWKIYEQSSFQQGTSGTTTLYIPAQRIVGAHIYQAGVADTINVIEGTKDDCDPTKRTDVVPSAGVALTLYFYAFGNGTGTTPTASATWGDVGYDLIGPTPPSTVSVASADTQLYLNWAQVLDSDLAGYHIYCKNPDGLGPDGGIFNTGVANSTGGASSSGGASATGGSSSAGAGTSTGGAVSLENPNCADSVLAQSNLPPEGMGYNGQVGGITATSGIASGLTNGASYACAVSAYDTRKNDGPFSVVQCGRPWWVNDFFSTYRTTGGKGGGGFCSIGQRGSGLGLLIPLASLGLLALRRKRALSPKSKRTST